MIFIDSYDKEILDAVGEHPGINLHDLQFGVGRQSTPFRKKVKRLTELGLITVKKIPAKESRYSYRLNNVPIKTFYLNKKLLKETNLIENERKN